MAEEQVSPVFTVEQVTAIMKHLGVPVENLGSVTGQMASHRKDTMPAEGRPALAGRLYDNGPFGLAVNDVISSVVTGGGPLMNWLPSNKMKARVDTVSHLEWVSPEGFDGSTETYQEWLAGLEITDCDYGPSTQWSGFSYQMTGGHFSWKTEMMKVIQDGGLPYHERQPIYTTRGSSPGIVLSSDKDWAVARLLLMAEQHVDFILKHGRAANSQMEWDGLETIIQPGYVQGKIFGTGIAHWANPLWVNGSAITTAGEALTQIRLVVRSLRNRAAQRGWTINAGDQVVLMSKTMWDNIAEAIAAGGMYAYTNEFGFNGEMSYRDFRAEYRDTKTGGFGFGTIDVDGQQIPVLVDPNMGTFVEITDAEAAVTPAVNGDIYILCRRANGMNLLEQQYVDFTDLSIPPGMNDFVMNGGNIRAGWVTEANACYYYHLEMMGRMVTYMQPLQGRINNVTIPILGEMEHETGYAYTEDFYARKENGILTPL
jgi:hypothetical protein